LRLQHRVAEKGDIDIVELQITAAGRRQIGDFLAIDAGEVGIKFADIGIGAVVDGASTAAEMHGGW
jgi:hypothetical protein